MTHGPVASLAPLTEAETRAALRAVRRVLDLARQEADTQDREKLADVLSAAGELPELIARPDQFRDRFRPTLADLAYRHHEFAAVLSEFDRATDPPRRRRRRPGPHDELWRDCGAGD
jgi:hypothetical protein